MKKKKRFVRRVEKLLRAAEKIEKFFYERIPKKHAREREINFIP